MRYPVEVKPSAAKSLAKLPRPFQVRIAQRIDALSVDPQPLGAEQLRGHQNLLRIRAGDYRIIYTIMDDRLIVLVVRIGHRREVYRGL